MARKTSAAAPSPRVKQRRVLYIHGFDPRGPAAYHALFAEEATRSIAGVEVGPRRRQGAHAAAWKVTAPGVETDYLFLRWDDLVRARWSKNELQLLGELWLWVWAWTSRGFTARASRDARALFFAMLSTPVVALLFILAVLAAAAAIGFVAGLAAHGLSLPYWVGGLAAAPLLFAAPPLWRRLEARLNVCWLSRCFNYMRGRHEGRVADLAQRDALLTRAVAEAWADRSIDEVLVVGHSLGALHAVSAIAGALRLEPELGADGRLSLLTLGQPIAVHTALPGDPDFRRDLQAVASAAQVPWLDVTSPSDPASACHLPPLEAVDASPGRITQRSPRFHVYLEPERFRAIRSSPIDFHFEYLRAPDRQGGFDYFAFVAGPQRMVDQPWLKAGGK